MSETLHPPILVATDLSARSDRAVDRALALSEAMGTRAIVCHVVTPGSKPALDQDRTRQRIRSVLSNPEEDVDIILPSGSAPEAIARVADAINPLLIVMGVARYNSVGDYFLGTAVDHVVKRTKTPVLIVKQRPHRAYKNIIVAVDYSTCSRYALCRAAELFPEASLNVVHAYHVPFEAWQKSQYIHDATRAENERHLAEFLAQPEISDAVRARISSSLLYGDVAAALFEAVERIDPDLVVMGTHGTGGFVQTVIGSMASSMLQWLDTDCLLIRE